MQETDPLYSEFRGYGRARIEDTFQVVGERYELDPQILKESASACANM